MFLSYSGKRLWQQRSVQQRRVALKKSPIYYMNCFKWCILHPCSANAINNHIKTALRSLICECETKCVTFNSIRVDSISFDATSINKNVFVSVRCVRATKEKQRWSFEFRRNWILARSFHVHAINVFLHASLASAVYLSIRTIFTNTMISTWTEAWFVSSAKLSGSFSLSLSLFFVN